MSKQKATKRSASINTWMKKENLSEKKVDIDESQAKILKRTVRICLEPIKIVDNQAKEVLHRVDAEAIEKQTRKNQKAQKQNIEESQTLRRSARNLPPEEKPVELVKIKEPYIEDLPPIVFGGKIKYYSDFYEIANICDQLLAKIEAIKENIIPIGFDLEWPFNFQTGSGKTALAQVCMSLNICYLFHIYNLKKLPASFIALLSHSKVKLVGVNVKNDIWKLTRDFSEFPGKTVVDNNCLDCGKYANTVLSRSCRWSLDRLTAYLLKKKLSKDPKVRNSKWHMHPLSDVQRLYAATDAYVSLLLHLTIEQEEAVIQVAQEAAKVSLDSLQNPII